MLELLHIENIAIIDRADITFEPGFNALTGETGAGKSIVIDSLSAVLGQRTSRDLIRTGADKAYVSACFTGIPPEVGEDLGITWDEELLLQREIHADGKNVCRVGSRPVTVTQLRTLGTPPLPEKCLPDYRMGILQNQPSVSVPSDFLQRAGGHDSKFRYHLP